MPSRMFICIQLVLIQQIKSSRASKTQTLATFRQIDARESNFLRRKLARWIMTVCLENAAKPSAERDDVSPIILRARWSKMLVAEQPCELCDVVIDVIRHQKPARPSGLLHTGIYYQNRGVLGKIVYSRLGEKHEMGGHRISYFKQWNPIKLN